MSLFGRKPRLSKREKQMIRNAFIDFYTGFRDKKVVTADVLKEADKLISHIEGCA